MIFGRRDTQVMLRATSRECKRPFVFVARRDIESMLVALVMAGSQDEFRLRAQIAAASGGNDIPKQQLDVLKDVAESSRRTAERLDFDIADMG